uniref:Globin domain-containing protein n=1 Tax=Compsopogon caeruleus TaxID=31354 RepID=A0A7S1TAC7_9RHOD|mmetsp:Transcript_13796/g.28323  ORF Transcript_13796/g.28323 Transcript_13796/m.28323 type:complete len:324 (+) Transcript_13796:111-1082(+)
MRSPSSNGRVNPKVVAATKELSPVFEKHGDEIATRMYDLLFTEHPDLRHLFSLEFMRDSPSKHPILKQTDDSDHSNESTASCPFLGALDSAQRPSLQASKLANSIMNFCTHIDDLDQFETSVDRITRTHVMRGIHQEHYPYLQKALIQSIKDIAGLDAKHHVLFAFEKSFSVLSDVLIGRELQMRKALKKQHGGWEGFRLFTIVDRQDAKEGGGKMYITMESEDGAPVIKFVEGQDVCIRWDDPEQGLVVKRFRLHQVLKPFDPHKCFTVVVSRSLSKAAVGATELLLEYGQIGYEIEVSPPVDLHARVDMGHQNWLQRMFFH